MGFSAAVKSCFGKYDTFRGRAARSEFWYFHLFILIMDVALVAAMGVLTSIWLDAAKAAGIALALFHLAVLLPSLSVTVRQLHDRGRSGWHYWWTLVPVIGGIIVLLWFCKRGVEGENRFGADPLSGGSA